MSRNQDRLGLEDNPIQSEPTAATATVATAEAHSSSQAPTFNWSVPTEFVELPSMGLFYPQGHPLHKQKTAEIRYMTAKEEDILTSRALLKEGVALDRMLQNLLVNGDIRVSSLLVGDKNALLVAARKTGYGAEYETNVTCPACGETNEHSFDISDPPSNDFIKKADEAGISLANDSTVEITLPMSQVKVVCRLMNSEDEIKLSKQLERKSKRKQDTGVTTDSFRAYIMSVNGDDSPFSIESFIHAMPARDARYLRNVYTSIVPNIDLTQLFECSSCGYSTDMEVPLGVDFFWPK